MQHPAAQGCVLVLALAALCAGDAALTPIALHQGRTALGVEGAGRGSEARAAEVDEELESLVEQLLTSGVQGKPGPGRRQLTKAGLKKVNLKVAVERLQGKLPSDVASLVHQSVDKTS